MHEFTEPLANAIKQSRSALGLTQEQVAELACTDPMNIMKMENVNRNANPEMATLYPVIRALKKNPREIFYPEEKQDNPRIRLLQQLISDCSDNEADALIPIIRELIQFMRGTGCFVHNKNTKSCRPKWRKLHLHFGESCIGFPVSSIA